MSFTEKNVDDEQKEKNYCSICLSNVCNDVHTRLACKHVYHTKCYTSYIAHNIVNRKEHIECPLCRNLIIQIIIHNSETSQINNEENNQNNGDDDDFDDEIENCNEICYCITFCCVKLVLIGVIGFLVYLAIHCSTSYTC